MGGTMHLNIYVHTGIKDRGHEHEGKVAYILEALKVEEKDGKRETVKMGFDLQVISVEATYYGSIIKGIAAALSRIKYPCTLIIWHTEATLDIQLNKPRENKPIKKEKYSEEWAQIEQILSGPLIKGNYKTSVGSFCEEYQHRLIEELKK